MKKYSSFTLACLYGLLLLCVLGRAATIPPRTIGIPVLGQAISGQHKWNTGVYGVTYNTTLYCGVDPTTYTNEISSAITPNLISNGGRITGYAFYAYWTLMECGGQGNWQFTGCTPPAYTSCGNTFPIDKIFNALRTAGGKVAFEFNLGFFGGSSQQPSAGDDYVIPGYITNNNPGTGGGNCPTYGRGNTGSSGTVNAGACGWYTDLDSTYVANLMNANVYTRFKAMITQFCAVFDQDPVFEGFVIETTDSIYPYAGTGLQGDGWISQMETMTADMQTACPHSSVAFQVGSGLAGTTIENFTDYLAKHQVFISGSDAYGGSAWTDFSGNSGQMCPRNSGFTTVPPSGTSDHWASSASWNCPSSPAGASSNYYAQFKMPSSGATLNNVSATYNSNTFSWQTTTGTPSGGGDFYARISPAPWLIPDGQLPYIGLLPPGSSYTLPTPSLQSYGTSWQWVEGGDICGGSSPNPPGVFGYFVNYNPTDLIAGANATGINGYNAGHLFITILTSGNCSNPANPHAIWGNASTNPSAIYDINHLAQPIMVNTARPPGY